MKANMSRNAAGRAADRFGGIPNLAKSRPAINLRAAGLGDDGMPELGSAAEWYVSVNGAQHGPMSEAELKGLIQQRRVSPDDYVWCPAFTEWKRAGDAFHSPLRPPPLPSAPRAPAAARAASPAAPVGRASGGGGGMAVASLIFYVFIFLLMGLVSLLIVALGVFLHAFFFLFLLAPLFGARLLFKEMILGLRQNVFTVDERSFRQNGVVVDFERRMVKINGTEYSPDAIRDLATTWGTNSASVDISVDNVGKPVERVRFISWKARNMRKISWSASTVRSRRSSKRATMRRFGYAAACFLSLVLFADLAHTARLPALDKAWTDHCVALYKERRVLGGGVHNFCVCLQEIVGHADRFDSVSALERKYPRQERSCRRKTGLRMR
jgi:hypothetical protein